VLVVVVESAPGRLLAEVWDKVTAMKTMTMIDAFTIETIVVVEVKEFEL
jgi:hypothetical protein